MKNINKNILFLALGIISPLSVIKPNNKKITDLPTEVLWTLADCDNPAKSLEWMNNLAQTNKELHDKISPEILTYLCKKESGKSDNHSIMQTASKHGMFKIIDHVKKQTPFHIDYLAMNPLREAQHFIETLKLMHLFRATSKHMKKRYDSIMEETVKINPDLHQNIATISIDQGFPKILELVLKFSDINPNHISYTTLQPSNHVHTQNYVPLSRAIINGKYETVRVLLRQKNIDINKLDSKKRTPLIQSIISRNLDVIRLLLKSEKIEVNKPCNLGIPPLIFAFRNKEKVIQIIELLLTHPKIDVNKVYYYGNTPLLYAIRCHMNEVSQKLLNHPKIDVNKANNGGKTPLMFAVKYNNIPIVKMLLNRSDIRPNVPKLFLLAKDNDEICEILKAWTKRKK